VKARGNDGETPPRAIGRFSMRGAVTLHEAATSSKMCPSFERLVSM
jgi:hypothetical protein